MATNPKLTDEEKFERQDFNLFDALAALDRKDYGYYDTLTEEQKKKFVPFMMTHWMSAIKGSEAAQRYYVMSTEYNTNKYLFDDRVSKHPKLQWLMLCAASPGMGKQYHQWIPMIRDKVARYKEPAKQKEITDYYTKLYPNADKESIKELSQAYVEDQKRKLHLCELFPTLKLADIETLNQVVTNENIEQYEKDLGN